LNQATGLSDDFVNNCCVVAVIEHGIKIDNVQPLRPLRTKIECRFDRIYLKLPGSPFDPAPDSHNVPFAAQYPDK
jgi:hypothetical protein